MNMKLSRHDILLLSWDFALERESWNPPLAKVLEGLNEEQANWRPETGTSNTIRETVNHLIFYKEQLLQRLKGMEPSQPERNGDTFITKVEEPEDWEQTVARLIAVHHGIRSYLSGFQDDDLDRPLPQVPIGGQVLTLVMHDAYHTGQIVLLRKLQGSWPSSRDFG
jgi:uncharacterized damage-inducible protein DinB